MGQTKIFTNDEGRAPFTFIYMNQNTISGRMPLSSPDRLSKLLESFGVKEAEKRACSFSFSSKAGSVPSGWRAFTFDLAVPFWFVTAPGARTTEIRSLAAGIPAENYMLLADAGAYALLVLRRHKKDDNSPLLIPMRKDEEFERVMAVMRRLNFRSDQLVAHANLMSAVELLRAGAEGPFINRGLFSTYFLKERLLGRLSERGRNPAKEPVALFTRLNGEVPTDPSDATRVLEALGYAPVQSLKQGYPEYVLRSQGTTLKVCCIVAPAESLDTKTGDRIAPSYQAVASLREHAWAILTNGRLWRLYSSRIASSSTNYFEVDLDGIAEESDPRLAYFTSLFSAASFVVKDGTTDADLIYEGGISHAREVEDDLRAKIFDDQLFLNLVRGILNFDNGRSFGREELDAAKELALKLLYRLLFVLYAESRGLLPLENPKYRDVSVENMRSRLPSLEKQPEGTGAWDTLRTLFGMISRGDVEANMPEYDGELFSQDERLDAIMIKNQFLVPALDDLTTFGGRGIDYQNLGVRHLGSLYEALLEYSVKQAEKDLVVYREEILDATYAADLKAKPKRLIEKGDLYLSVGGLARKGTGSYYTPDEIVRFLVEKGLEPHFREREKKFREDMVKLRQGATPELERETVEDLLGLRVVDPAMGSGHFLVAAVNEVTNWIIELLKEYPDAPLARVIEGDRRTILLKQTEKGIKLKEDLLTDTVILKRMVMKRCVYGVDLNPLAVELAKLSLWLDSFTIGTPLTFLDHHVRCGDSLMGLWRENVADRAFQTSLERWAGEFKVAGADLFGKVSLSADLTVEQLRQSRDAYGAVKEKTAPLKILLDRDVAALLDPELGERLSPNLAEIVDNFKKNEKEKPAWWADVEKAIELARKYRAFHWEFEFPDAYGGDGRGFDLVIMNPPWDAVKPEDDDFFSTYYPGFRRITSKPEKRKVMEKLLQNSEVAKAYEEYRHSIEQKLRFYKSEEYVRRGSGDTNLWKLFLDRGLKAVPDKGSLAVVIPSGIVTDEGGKQLREALFKGRIRTLFEFENKNGIFPDIDSRMKFALLVWDNAGPVSEFPAAFYLHDVQALTGKTEQDKFVKMTVDLVKKCAPETLSIPEIRNEKQMKVFSKLYQNHPLLGDPKKGWTVALVRELDRTNDSDLFRTDGKGWPLIEGKSFHQFLPDYEKVMFTVDPDEGLKRTARHREYLHINEKIHKDVRLVFRDVASSTNVRSMIACVIPPESFCSNKAIVVLPIVGGSFPKEKDYPRIICHLAGVFNSFIFDFLIRLRVTMSLNFFYVYQTSIPGDYSGPVANRIVDIAAKLSSIDACFEKFASSANIRVKPLSMRERIELTAELNALVAKHYGLTRQELEVVLSSFDGFKEDKELINLEGAIKWSDDLIRRFNEEVRKRVLSYFDQLIKGGT